MNVITEWMDEMFWSKFQVEGVVPLIFLRK